jgi:hypothetical protein
LRKLPLYIFTENLNFFYRINKALKEKKINFKILNIRNKIPNTYSIILTTAIEYNNRLRNSNTKSIILPYSDIEKFEFYILKVVAAHRIGYKETYSSLTFSIDPGYKIGLMIFLDGFYLDSYCCFKQLELIKKLETFISYFKSKNNSLRLNFKFGIGVISIAYKLVDIVFNTYKDVKSLRVFLIDEFKSSKVKLNEKGERKFSKDEISALILSLREGTEVYQTNYENIFNHLKEKKMKIKRSKYYLFQKKNEFDLSLEDIARSVLNGELSLIESIKFIKENSYNL